MGTLAHPVVIDTAREAARWLQLQGCTDLSADSRALVPKVGLLAYPGQRVDPRGQVNDLLLGDVSACLVEAEGMDAFGLNPERVAGVVGLKSLAGEIAHHFYGEPSLALPVVAVTGTNGKTSMVWWLSQALAANRQALNAADLLLKSEQQSESNRWQTPDIASNFKVHSLMIGTLGFGQVPQVSMGGLTTPDAVRLQSELAHAKQNGASSAAIEASSIGIVAHRLNGLHIAVAVFTNFTQDHLDFHGDMAAYWQAKRALFSWPGLRAAVVNIDDPKGAELSRQLQGQLDRWTYSTSTPARLSASRIECSPTGTSFCVTETQAHGPHKQSLIQTSALGLFNVSNLLGVIATQRALGISLDAACGCLPGLQGVPGRLEVVTAPHGPLTIVDYAHTPDALTQALRALRPVAQARGGELWCVFGCGGDRDPGKRPQMARACELGADQVVLTSDNPRNENPAQIAAQVVLGFQQPKRVPVELDRAKAIADTVTRAKHTDVVLIAGKGHERHQEIANVRHSFCDQEHAQLALLRLQPTQSSP